MTTRTRRSAAKTPPRGYHHGNLRQALIDAALAIVEASGPDAVTVREAARRAGVSPGAPFRHFADKNQLMTAVAEEGLRRLREAREHAVAAAGEDPLDRFRAMGVAYVVFAAKHPAHFRVMNMPEYTSGSGSALIREDEARGEAEVRDVMAAAQDAGAIGEGPPEPVLLAASTVVYGAARMFVDGHFARMGIGVDRAEWVAELVTGMLGAGFMTKRATTRPRARTSKTSSKRTRK